MVTQPASVNPSESKTPSMFGVYRAARATEVSLHSVELGSARATGQLELQLRTHLPTLTVVSLGPGISTIHTLDNTQAVKRLDKMCKLLRELGFKEAKWESSPEDGTASTPCGIKIRAIADAISGDLVNPDIDKPENRPKGGGEFFGSRGIGTDDTPGCFVCGGEDGTHSNIAAFVKSRSAGARVVMMFQYGARLDYRDWEPTWIQVKIGACEQHTTNLAHLHELTSQKGIITKEAIDKAIAGGKFGLKCQSNGIDDPHLSPRHGVFETEAKARAAAQEEYRSASWQVKYPLYVVAPDGKTTRVLPEV